MPSDEKKKSTQLDPYPRLQPTPGTSLNLAPEGF
jgi:hypothetical protein